MTSTDIGCYICQQDPIPLGDIRALPCGHCYCKCCLEREKDTATCAVCRKNKGKSKEDRLGIPLYIHLVELSPSQVVQATTQQLNDLDKCSNSTDVRRAINNLGKALELDDSHLDELREASATLKERMYPVYERLEVALSDNDSLLSQISALQRNISTQESMVEKYRTRSSTVKRTIAERDRAIAISESYKSKAASLEEKVARRYRSLEGKQQEIDALKEQNRNLQRSIKVAQRKSKELVRQSKNGALAAQTQDPDESLIVEGLELNLTNGIHSEDRNSLRPSKRRKKDQNIDVQSNL